MELVDKSKEPALNAGHDNKGVIVIEDKPGESEGLGGHPMMIEGYKERMADVIAMLDKQKEFMLKAQAEGQKAHVIDKEAKKIVDQKQLDDVFLAFMDKEYKDE